MFSWTPSSLCPVQVREVLAHQVNGIGEVAGASHLDSRDPGAGVDGVPEHIAQLVRRVAGQRVEETVHRRSDEPERRAVLPPPGGAAGGAGALPFGTPAGP